MRVAVAGCLAASAGVSATVACAEDGQILRQTPRSTLRYDLRLDGAITVAALVVWGGGNLLNNQLGPAACRWCRSNPLDDGVRDGLRWSAHGGAANTASNVTAYLLAPARTSVK
jgi:hypothetical protein